MSGPDFTNLSMWELFRFEAEEKVAALTNGLVALETSETPDVVLRDLMRAAHSLKGAAAMVEARVAVRLAHAMEDILKDLQQRSERPTAEVVDKLLGGANLLKSIAASNEEDRGESLSNDVDGLLSGTLVVSKPAPEAPVSKTEPEAKTRTDEQTLRVPAERVSRLLALAGESLITNRGLDELVSSIARRRLLPPEEMAQLTEMRERSSWAASQLYRAVIDLRMRPFGELTSHYRVLARTLARELNKEVTFVIEGGDTPVDRDIMERLDAPFVNMIRNSIDHGIDQRGTVKLSASHRAGLLFIRLEDDGRGVDLHRLRELIVERKLATEEVAARLTDSELLEFLFLPGFSMKRDVTEISGRGVGMDIVQTVTRELGGRVTIATELGKGMSIEFQLPVTLSVLRALLVDIGGEAYAFPISRVERVVKVPRSELRSVEGRHNVDVDDEPVGLVLAHQILETESKMEGDVVSAVVIGQGRERYALAVDRFLGESELVVRPLDPLLGKVKDVSSAALLPDNTTVLILDVEDMLVSIDNLVTGGRIAQAKSTAESVDVKRKRILVVDDSFTVRELERKMLAGHGYDVDVAVDGADGWNSIRNGHYDLVVTDVDMPRMDGIALIAKIRQDPRFNLLPVIIVSYKEREEDRLRGLEVGADRYLTKSSYQDASMLTAVEELIGKATE